MLEKTTRMNDLYDFYQSLLTPKQRSYMSLYYLDDLSLGEIAEQYGVSRQAVYDNIKRTEQTLEDYEKSLVYWKNFKRAHAFSGRCAIFWRMMPIRNCCGLSMRSKNWNRGRKNGI